jgi:hypothetical protein
LTLAEFVLIEVGLGRSLINGYEGLVFLAVQVAGLAFEAIWTAVHGTNAIKPFSPSGTDYAGQTNGRRA